jgi:hypothetical protein
MIQGMTCLQRIDQRREADKNTPFENKWLNRLAVAVISISVDAGLWFQFRPHVISLETGFLFSFFEIFIRDAIGPRGTCPHAAMRLAW